MVLLGLSFHLLAVGSAGVVGDLDRHILLLLTGRFVAVSASTAEKVHLVSIQKIDKKWGMA